jgi:hypothetical protein
MFWLDLKKGSGNPSGKVFSRTVSSKNNSFLQDLYRELAGSLCFKHQILYAFSPIYRCIIIMLQVHYFYKISKPFT